MLARTPLLVLALGQAAIADPAPLAEFCAVTAAEAPEACVGAVVASLIAWGLEEILGNNPYNERVAWFQGFIDNAAQTSPSLNVLAIATYYKNPFEHGSGVGQVIGDCGHTHHEIPMSGDWGVTQGVEIYTVGSDSDCCVEKWGDGGWTNWGYYGGWSQTTTSTGSLMMCLRAQPPSQPPEPIGVQRYSIGAETDLVTVNGVVGRLLREGGPLYSFTPPSSLFKWENAQSGPYYQAVVQTDGNFAVYHFDAKNNRKAVFWTNTGGKVDQPYWMLMPQQDGNLVLYLSDLGGARRQPVWASQTGGINVGSGLVGLSMQQDGNLVLYAFYSDGSCDPIWASNGKAPTGEKVWPHSASKVDGETGEL